MFQLSNSEKMDEFMALASKPAREASRPAERKPSYKFNAKGELVFENAPKNIENPYSNYSASNKKIVDTNKKIDEAKVVLDKQISDARSLRSFIAVINKANEAIKRNVIAKNASALDVMSVFSTFGMPKKSIIKTDDNGKQTAKTFEAVSPARAINIFEKFVTSKGYTLANSSQVIRMNDLADILAGVKAGKALTATYNVKSVLEAIKTANALDESIADTQKEIAMLTQQQDQMVKNNRQNITISVPTESVINKKQTDVRIVEEAHQKLESEITGISSRVALLKASKTLSTEQVKQNLDILKEDLKSLHVKYNEYRKLLKEAPSIVSQQRRIGHTLARQEELLQRRRVEKINALQGKYARLPKAEAAKKIKEYMKHWDKAERDALAIRNKQAGREVDKSKLGLVESTTSELERILKKIGELDDTVKEMASIAKMTNQERIDEANTMQAILSKKKEELKNTAKKIARRQAVLEAELNSDMWEARIEKLLDDDKFVKQARRHMPLACAIIALHSGAEKRSKEMMRYAWEHFQPTRQTKISNTLKQKLVVAPIHFGSHGFMVDPKYPKLNPQLVMMIDFGIKANMSLNDDNMSDLLLKACMDAFRKDAESLSAHKQAYEAFFADILKWMKTPKALTVLEEIVEELVADGKIQTPNKMNKKQLTVFTHDMIDLIKNANAIKKLASFVWPSYREEIHTWLRNSFKVVTTKKGAM